MNQKFDDELTEEERQAFAGLPRERVPPSQLEERVVHALNQSGMLSPRGKARRGNAVRIAMALAASLLFFVLGAAAMRWYSKQSPAKSSPEFMLVLRQTSAQSRHGSAKEELRIAREYGNWARQLSQQGVPVDGEKLKEESRILSVVDGRPVASENALDLNRASIAGYFLIRAQSYEQAIKFAESCPHLKYGGSIEVRELDRF
ncbi:MAG TPA: hypothetical protein VJU86_15695 [Pyrinomonadaceae bacterium]|nr:hypothetical protein [Pyrinomonadaceae bacterium]